MTYEDVKQRVYDILFMSPEEISRLGYADKVARVFNEGLHRIANSVSPYIREYTIRLTRSSLHARVTMPPDFISFYDDQNAYVNGENFILTNFIGRDGLILTGKEVMGCRDDIFEYTFFYNALYPKAINGGREYEMIKFNVDPPLNEDNWYRTTQPTEASRMQDETVYEIPDSIAPLLPHYIVGQLLVQDDKVRSAQEMNEFEIMLATVNVDQNERQREYYSSKGWY